MRRAVLAPAVCALLASVLAGCATADEEAPTTFREETKTFELPPGGSVEYKLRLSEEASLDYAWSVGRPVTFDFHGDTGAEAFTSYKEGVALADQDDAWRAPFDGRHGWYWKNNNPGSVTITLTTKGVYDAVGITGGNIR